jgi:hypothetical protein
MIELGLLGTSQDQSLAEDDLWLVQAWADIQRQGFAHRIGLDVSALVLLQEVVQDLFNREALLLASRIERLAPDEAAKMIEQSLPIVHGILTSMHTAKIRNFFASLE